MGFNRHINKTYSDATSVWGLDSSRVNSVINQLATNAITPITKSAEYVVGAVAVALVHTILTCCASRLSVI
jgi:hypothetical protein